jgi:hypothetical protein
MLGEDVNIFKVQKIVGHRQISTTAGYTHLTTKDIINAIKKDPLARGGLPPEDVLQHVVTVLRGLAETNDERFECALQETPGGVTFGMRIKKIKQIT